MGEGRNDGPEHGRHGDGRRGQVLIDIVPIVWFLPAGLSAAHVAGDSFANTPS